MNRMEEINSKAYWDQRFASNWESHNGPRYTYFHGEVLLRHLPEWLVSEINQQKLSICDWGCAEGDAVNIFTSRFPANRVCGVDFAAPAIESAKKNYPGCKFFCQNWLTDSVGEKYDIIYSSHTLEHFRTPFQVMAENLLPRANRYLVVMVPFAENPQKMDPEHFFRFIPEVIPQKLGNWDCVFYKVINSLKEDDFWRGIQVLLVFANPENSAANLTMASMPGESAWLELEVKEKNAACEKLQHELQVEKEKRNLQNEHAKVILDQNTRLTAMVNSQKEGVAAKDAKITELQKNLAAAQTRINELKSEVELEKEKRALQHQNSTNILEQNRKLTEMLTAANNNFRESMQTLTRVNTELAETRAAKASVQQELITAAGEIKNLTGALNDANDKVENLTGALNDANKKLAASNDGLTNCQRQLEAKQQALTAANAKAGNLTNEVAIAKAESKILRQRLEEKNARCQALQADNDAKSAACRELEIIRQTKSFRLIQKINRLRAKVCSWFGIEYPRKQK